MFLCPWLCRMAAGSPDEEAVLLRRKKEELDQQIGECKRDSAELQAQLHVALAEGDRLSRQKAALEEEAGRNREPPGSSLAEAKARERVARQRAARRKAMLRDCQWELANSEAQLQALRRQVDASRSQPQQAQQAQQTPTPQKESSRHSRRLVGG